VKLVDQVEIYAKAGDGGPGATHFRREKFVPRGGPDGGNGGRGGSVIVVADHGKHTLLDFRYQPEWRAPDGAPGGSSQKDGRQGEDLTIPVPTGTEVYSSEDLETPICDLTQHGQQFVLLKGGRGGKGNTFFKSSTNQTPLHSQKGEQGGEGHYVLSLKLLADVGLVGLPNAGKSTFISRISNARPKIADYPFTTLEPQLGVARGPYGRTFVIADIPGLIPGAHKGKGLGLQFLKHLDRTSLLLHLLDCSSLEDESSLDILTRSLSEIENELREFSEKLFSRPRVVLLTKIDAVTDRELLSRAELAFKALGHQVFTISSVSGEGLDKCLAFIESELNRASQEESPSL